MEKSSLKKEQEFVHLLNIIQQDENKDNVFSKLNDLFCQLHKAN
ncbi:hypothetical protein [Heyndrickxia camelliae]|nr:hypothetical protein [Heyndrickxia camelliae]